MWGYRQRRSGYGMNLSKMLSVLVFFLLMGLISSAGIPTMLMSKRQAPNQAKVFHANTQMAKVSRVKHVSQVRTNFYQSPVSGEKAFKATEKESDKTLGI